MIRRPPRSTLSSSSAASDVYKRQGLELLAAGGAGCAGGVQRQRCVGERRRLRLRQGTAAGARTCRRGDQLAGLAPLRPWVAFVTEDSGRRSAEALTRTPGNLPPLPATVVSIDEDKIDG